MKCESFKDALDQCFDMGETPDGALRKHLDGCPTCAAYYDQLEDLDTFLGAPAAVDVDEIFVARVQNAVARSSRGGFPVWARVAAVLLVIAGALGAGWMLEPTTALPTWNVTVSEATLPSLPNWIQVTSALKALPETLLTDTDLAIHALGDSIGQITAAMRSPLEQHGLLMWSGGLAGLVLLVVVNARERRWVA